MKHLALGIIFALPPVMLASSPAASPTGNELAAYSSSTPAVEWNTTAVAEPGQTVIQQPKGDDGKGRIVGSFGVAGVYSRQFTLSSSTGQFGADGRSHNLIGWSVTPEVNFTKHIGLQADFISLYDMNSPYAINNIFKLAMLAGPRYTFNPYWKATPFVFGEAGETRTSFGTTYFPTNNTHPGVDWAPTAKAGIGFDVKASRNFAIQLIPAEWMGERYDWSGKWQHNYQARLGFVFYLRK